VHQHDQWYQSFKRKLINPNLLFSGYSIRNNKLLTTNLEEIRGIP
jgi:hypothetical protein